MKKIYILGLILFALTSCKKDPMSEINDGAWNRERNIVNIKFGGQIGNAEINRNTNEGNIKFYFNMDSGIPMDAVPIDLIEISYGAVSSVSKGRKIDFSNESHTTEIIITPVNGEQLVWTVSLIPFKETLLGTWNVKSLVVFGGTGPEYGGAGVVRMTDKSWCWNNNGPAREEDNTLTITLNEITSEGNTKGKIINDAGNDGKYADFIFVNSDPVVDVNHFYRTLPKGEGSWFRNYTTGKVTFTFPDGSTKEGEFVEPGEYDLGFGQKRVLETSAFVFNLQGSDDWKALYSDFDKFVKRPRKFWIDISK